MEWRLNLLCKSYAAKCTCYTLLKISTSFLCVYQDVSTSAAGLPQRNKLLQMLNPLCPRFDSLRIYDGATEGDRYLANLCGRIKNRFRLQSSGTHLLLKFRSDMINTRPGFRAAVDFTWGESQL